MRLTASKRSFVCLFSDLFGFLLFFPIANASVVNVSSKVAPRSALTWSPPPLPSSTAPPLPAGTEPANDEDPEKTAGDGWGYFNIVNGSPYNFVVADKQSQGMSSGWNWVTIPPGQGYQSFFNLTSSQSTGEVTYKLDGPGETVRILMDRKNGFNVTVVLDKRFVERSKSKQQVVQKHFQKGRAMNLVITGAEDLGYWASTDPPPDWMQQLWPVIGNRRLRHICMPGSHDAGLSVMNHITVLATRETTQTQVSDIYGQLMQGSRFFDIRPVIVNQTQFFTGHYYAAGKATQGGNGQSIDSIIENLNRFTSQYKELVILRLSHTMNTDNEYEDFTQAQWDKLFQKLSGINHRLVNSKLKTAKDDITSMRLNELINPNEGRVVIVAHDTTEVPFADGIFTATNFPYFDRYANSALERVMAEDQIKKLHDQRSIVADTSARKDPFFILSWTLTNGASSILRGKSIADLALDQAYDSLFWRGLNAFTPESFPNVLYMDFLGTADWAPRTGGGEKKWPAAPPAGVYPDVMLLAMAVNLQIASRNAYIQQA